MDQFDKLYGIFEDLSYENWSSKYNYKVYDFSLYLYEIIPLIKSLSSKIDITDTRNVSSFGPKKSFELYTISKLDQKNLIGILCFNSFGKSGWKILIERENSEIWS